MTANAELAARARQLADRELRGSRARAAALCCAVALGESASIAGARKILDAWDGPAAIRDAAIKALGQLASQESP